MRHRTEQLEPYLDRLRAVPFVRGIELRSEASELRNQRIDGELTIETPRKRYRLAVEVKRSFLDRMLTHAVINEGALLQKQSRLPLLLIARYIPRPTGERLAAAGVNFVDRAGNVHLKLGSDYHVLLLGRREPQTVDTTQRVSSRLVQLYFALLSDSDVITRPVRTLAEAAGISKTVAASLKQRLLQNGIVAQSGKRIYRVHNRQRLEEEFLRGYGQILRPRLVLGNFRPQESDPTVFVQNFAARAKEKNLAWAITGGPAGYALDRFYRGTQTPIFIETVTSELQRELKLLPDARGPVTFLRAFSKTVIWRRVDGLPCAHPWLIYAELLYQEDPRALQAAEEIREKYLQRDAAA